MPVRNYSSDQVGIWTESLVGTYFWNLRKSTNILSKIVWESRKSPVDRLKIMDLGQDWQKTEKMEFFKFSDNLGQKFVDICEIIGLFALEPFGKIVTTFQPVTTFAPNFVGTFFKLFSHVFGQKSISKEILHAKTRSVPQKSIKRSFIECTIES